MKNLKLELFNFKKSLNFDQSDIENIIEGHLNGYVEFGEKETGFIEEATQVFENSPELLIIGFDPEGENQVMVASNMKREVALHIVNSLQSALQVVDADGN